MSLFLTGLSQPAHHPTSRRSRRVPFVVGINPPQSNALDAFDDLITVLFGIDIVLGFLTAVAETGRSGELITDRRAIARRVPNVRDVNAHSDMFSI